MTLTVTKIRPQRKHSSELDHQYTCFLHDDGNREDSSQVDVVVMMDLPTMDGKIGLIEQQR